MVKGSEEEIIFYEGCIETPPSLVLAPRNHRVLDDSSPSSMSELPLDKGESIKACAVPWGTARHGLAMLLGLLCTHVHSIPFPISSLWLSLAL